MVEGGPRLAMARGRSRATCRVVPRSGAVARRRRRARSRAPRAARRDCRGARSLPGLRASRLVEHGAAALSPTCCRFRARARPWSASRATSTSRRTRWAARSRSRIPRITCASRPRLGRDRIPRGAGAPYRMRAAARRQQRLRQRAQPRLSARGVRRCVPGEHGDEVHLAGHTPDPKLGAGAADRLARRAVGQEVWASVRAFLARIGPRPTLIERDDNIPDFAALLAERDVAQTMLAAPARVAA